MQEAKINLGKVVRVARKRKRITQDYLAEKVGVQDTEQLFQELSSFSEEEQRMAAAAARAVLQQIRYEKEHCKEEVSNKTNG